MVGLTTRLSVNLVHSAPAVVALPLVRQENARTVVNASMAIALLTNVQTVMSVLTTRTAHLVSDLSNGIVVRDHVGPLPLLGRHRHAPEAEEGGRPLGHRAKEAWARGRALQRLSQHVQVHRLGVSIQRLVLAQEAALATNSLRRQP